VNLPVTNVLNAIVSKAMTLGMNHLHFPHMGAIGGPPDVARVVHHGTDELLIQQNSIVEAETASTAREKSQRS